jgi:enoyl-[acyl-carrier protein] reductase I
LKLKDKEFLITGLANKKSVAYFTAILLKEHGAKVIFSVHESNFEKAQALFPEDPIYICDVEKEDSVFALGETIVSKNHKLSGMLHSIAFANYSEGIRPFIETKALDFLQASNISCFSLISLSNALKNSFTEDASIVTVSISSTKATSYGYMGPIKAMLDATVPFLAKSFSGFSKVRVNAVCSGPLKTSASAGIPGYVDNYLFSEQLTLRGKNLKTEEVASTILFLLSPMSSGINGQGIVVDAGMSCNYFDEKVVNSFIKNNY